MQKPTFDQYPDQAALVEGARGRFVETVEKLQHNGGLARVVLTGGGAGVALLEALAADSGKIDWNNVLVFFGDERFVPLDSPDRNAGQAREALLDHISISEGNIFEIPLLDTPEESATAYATTIETHAPYGFDIHLLGMGGEGHINSLFPHTQEIAETELSVVAVHDCPKAPPTRVSLTMPAVKTSDRVWLLIAGENKSEAVEAIADGANQADWPAAGAQGRTETVVFVDDAAASRLK